MLGSWDFKVLGVSRPRLPRYSFVKVQWLHGLKVLGSLAFRV